MKKSRKRCSTNQDGGPEDLKRRKMTYTQINEDKSKVMVLGEEDGQYKKSVWTGGNWRMFQNFYVLEICVR